MHHKNQPQLKKFKRNFSANINLPTRTIPKQFELLYRARDGSPSKQMYESVIFMKSKKCPPSTNRNDKTFKNVKPNSKQLKNMIKNLEKEIKVKQSKELFTKKQSRNSGHPIKSAIDRKKQMPLRPSLSECNLKKQQSIKKKKQKSPEYQYNKTSPCFKQNISINNKEQTKRNRQVIALPNKQADQYVLIGDNFVSMKQKIVSELQNKFYNTFRQESWLNSQRQQQMLKTNSIHKFQDQIEPQSYRQHFSQQSCSQKQFELNCSHQQILTKIITIQRWWRKQLQEKRKYENSDDFMFQQNGSYKVLSSPSQNNFVISNNEILAGAGDFKELADNILDDINHGEEQVKKHQDNFLTKCYHEDQNCNSYQDILVMRQQAVKIQFKTHKQILTRLLQTNKIPLDAYHAKNRSLDVKLHEQLSQIEYIKEILKLNAKKTAQLMKKAQQEMALVQNHQISDEQLKKMLQITENQCKNKQITVFNREKSTGCHFQISPANSQHMTKQQSFEDCSQQSEQDDHKMGQDGQSEFYGSLSSMHPDFIMNSNFKQLLQQYHQSQNIKLKVEQRIACQMGMVQPQLENKQKAGINTSIASIHSFLMNFLKFYAYYYKDQFLRFINMPYGYNPQKRLAYMQNYSTFSQQEDEGGIIYGLQNIISQEILDQFHENFYQQTQNSTDNKKQYLSFEKTHNKAIFDALNEGLNYFRPYYSINGPPYLWNYSEKSLTFYFICEENIQEIFEKTQFKLLKWASALCGIIINTNSNQKPPTSTPLAEPSNPISIQQALVSYKSKSHPMITQSRQQRLFKVQKTEVQERNYEWFMFEEQKTTILYQTTALILQQLVKQLQRQMKNILGINSGRITQFDSIEYKPYLSPMQFSP